ncbi:septum formation initiator family protein [Streptomyces sp. PTM05]|uniref:Septum formation initiator family protein n=1 Tax=Streptantibioticus parmotrematis TaxID=2873249 RepID=A0ABS7QWY7_9ACTN|nr:septum formation initiator family protein [Streptantibioticus parmotrematis]MBY8887728.1 septum formation initiator family protein [Streptantibioticus parmotrematis]
MGADRFPTAVRLKALGQQAQARVYRATGRAPRRGRLTGRAALLALTVCALVVALAYPTRQYIAQRSQIAQQRKQAQQAKLRVEQLKEQQARWSDPEYVKVQARQQLHYVMPGETGYVMPGGQGSGASGAASGSAAGNRPWYENLWDGVDSADSGH